MALVIVAKMITEPGSLLMDAAGLRLPNPQASEMMSRDQVKNVGKEKMILCGEV
jgi:hypothetical protein